MRDEVLKYLYDIREAASAIKGFVAGKCFDDYCKDDLLRSGVERKFEIIGEALNKIRKDTPEFQNRIRGHRDIISFRNILAHGYDSVDDRIVWGIIEEDLEHLLEDVQGLLPKQRDDQ
jgi:uncharacterized protein with HEPN domain